MEKKYCSFPVNVTKAWVDSTTGKKMISGVASDDKLDWYIERFSVGALEDMVTRSKQRKPLKPEEGAVDILETHRESFGFGYVLDGKLQPNAAENSTEYYFEAALKEGWPQGEELWKDVKERRVDKQLSVGGYIPDWEHDYEFAEEPFKSDSGEEVMITVGVIKRFVLEHIAITPPDGAANPRTRFETAKGIDLGFKQGAVYKSAMDDGFQKSFRSKQEGDKPTGNSVVEESVFKRALENSKQFFKDLFGEMLTEREEAQMSIVEKAKKAAEDFRKMVAENPADFTEEVIKSLGISIVPEGNPEPAPTPEVVEKAKFDEFGVAIRAEIEEVKKSIPTLPEDKSEEITKSIQAKIDEAVAALDTRLKALETVTPPTQDEPVVVEKGVEPEVVEPEDKGSEVSCWR